MKKLILCLTILLSIQSAYCEIVIDNLPEVKYRNPDGTEFVPNSASYPKISEIERLTFNRTFEDEPIEIRLNRLERKIFQRDFSSDDDYLRMQRLQAAANAQQTARLYEANKIQKFTSTGLQIGSIILMILALIL